MSNVSELSDFELNKAIAELVYPDAKVSKHNDTAVYFKNPNDMPSGAWVGIVDYCHNWNDLMPLVDKYKINLIAYEGKDYWTANRRTSLLGGVNVESTSLQRCLAECLLLVLKAE